MSAVEIPENMKTKIAAIQGEFNRLATWEEKYSHLISIGKSLPSLKETSRIDENKVRGCQSQVWLAARFEDGKIYFEADSDASIVKGLVALVVRVYSGETPQDILSTPPNFIGDLGLSSNLSQARSNGLVAMIRQVMFYALAFK